MTFNDLPTKNLRPISETEVQLLADELVQFTDSPQSRLFFLKAISGLGCGLVRQAMAEVRMRENSLIADPVRDRVKYLITLLISWMKERGLYESTGTKEPKRTLPQTTFSIVDDPKKPRTIVPHDVVTTIEFPFSPDFVQWLGFVGPEYFTVKNEIAKSDRVERTTIPILGRNYDVPMLRGRLLPGGKEYGILTAGHMRAKGAVERIWADKKGPHQERGGICVVNASVPEIARYMRINTSGPNYALIKDYVTDLGATGYCYLLSENPRLAAMGLRDLSFKFFGEVQSVTIKNTTYFQIAFSTPYSAALLSRDKVIVSRPLDLLEIESGITWKLYLYLYPILMRLPRGEEHKIELKKLIHELDLRVAGWHHYKSQRKREFQKSVVDINGRKTHNGDVFNLSIQDGLNDADFILVARLDLS